MLKAKIAAIILGVFGAHGHAAVEVAKCESRLDPGAENGQYRGLFQMGRAERRRFSHGRYRTPLDQARAAHRYYLVAGWQPWTCRWVVE